MPYERSRRLLYGIQHQRKRGRRRILRGEQLPEQEKVMQAARSIGHFERGLTRHSSSSTNDDEVFRPRMWVRGTYLGAHNVRTCRKTARGFRLQHTCRYLPFSLTNSHVTLTLLSKRDSVPQNVFISMTLVYIEYHALIPSSSPPTQSPSFIHGILEDEAGRLALMRRINSDSAKVRP